MKLLILTLLCLAIPLAAVARSVSGPPPISPQDKSAADLVADAKSALNQRKFREAAELASKAIAAEPGRSEAYVVRGMAVASMGGLKEAIADFTKAIELKPEPTTYMHRGRLYSQLDEHAKSLADFDRAVELNPKITGAQRQRGHELFKIGEIEKSVAAFDRYIELEPENENGLWERGLSRYYARQFRAAQKSFEDYHKVGPDDTENDLWRMLSQAEVDGLAEAQKVLKTLHARRGETFPAMYDLYTGKITADEAFKRAMAVTTNDNDRRRHTFYTHLYLGMWFVATRDKPKAIEHIEKAVALRSTDYMWYVSREQLKRLKADGAAK